MTTLRARPTRLLPLLLIASIGSGGCAKKITAVDPGFTVPEGAESASTRLVAWGEAPNVMAIYGAGPHEPFHLTDVIAFTADNPGTFHGVILDSSVASGFQVLRREGDGGYRSLYDFGLTAARRWLDRHWEYYEFTDPDSSVPSHLYRGRGLLGGDVLTPAPLTNESGSSRREVGDIRYLGGRGGTDSGGNPIPLDSLFVMSWDTVPEAAGYLIHVFVYNESEFTLAGFLTITLPSPLFAFPGSARDILVAYVPATTPRTPTMSFQMPTPNAHPSNARIMTVRGTRHSVTYFIRISALDQNGGLIAYTRGNVPQDLVVLDEAQLMEVFDLPYLDIEDDVDFVGVVPTGYAFVTPTRARTSSPSNGFRARSSDLEPALAQMPLRATREPIRLHPPYRR